MKHKLTFQTKNEELHRLIWDSVREICHEYNVNLTGKRHDSTNVKHITLTAEIHSRKKLKNSGDSDQTIEL